MINCPHCGKSHYTEFYSTQTAVYYPPVWKDGVNVNPDGNVTTTKYNCLECHHDFIVCFQYGKVVAITDEGEVKPTPFASDVNITAMPTTTTINEQYCTIEKEPITNQIHYEWETFGDEIKELKARITQLEKDVAKLAGEVYELN